MTEIDDSTQVRVEDINSSGIRAWAGDNEALELIWSYGTGDVRLRGWQSADGSQAIETNGNPVFEGAEGFADLWEARGKARESARASRDE